MIITKENTSIRLLEKAINLRSHIGKTPLFEFEGLSPNPEVRILGKLEWHQLGGSVKARAAYHIIVEAIRHGQLNESRTLLDATSGNTGIAFAAIGAKLGIPVALALPENASKERIRTLRAYGAEIIFTSPFEGTDGAQIEAKRLANTQFHKFYYADQYANDHNWRAHFLTTAPEIFAQTDGKVTHFVAGLGTTGTFTGTTRKLRQLVPTIEAIALHPDAALHGLEGWKHMETAIVPKIYDPNLADRNLAVDTAEAYEMIKTVSRNHGLLISPSSAANLVGAQKVAATIDRGTIVTVLPDSAERYGEVMDSIYSEAFGL